MPSRGQIAVRAVLVHDREMKRRAIAKSQAQLRAIERKLRDVGAEYGDERRRRDEMVAAAVQALLELNNARATPLQPLELADVAAEAAIAIRKGVVG